MRAFISWAESLGGIVWLWAAESAQTSWRRGLIEKNGRPVQKESQKKASQRFRARSVQGDLGQLVKDGQRDNSMPLSGPRFDRHLTLLSADFSQSNQL